MIVDKTGITLPSEPCLQDPKDNDKLTGTDQNSGLNDHAQRVGQWGPCVGVVGGALFYL